MKFKFEIISFCLLSLAVLLTLILYPYGSNSAVLDPQGLIALKERDLMRTAILLMLIIVIPVFLLTFFICLRYRASNKAAKYDPEWDHSYLAESVWWGFPCLIVLLLSIITWTSSHDLDPYKKIESHEKALKIQVIALDWKWLFIYPEQEIASINYFCFPEKTPIYFEITAEAPMNSFWIPKLGGQIYAMPGMKTQLNLIADVPGIFRGSSANLSGEGFSGMVFHAQATSKDAFDKWVETVKKSPLKLDSKEYNQLVAPSEYNAVAYYNLQNPDLFDQTVMKFMMPSNEQAAKQTSN